MSESEKETALDAILEAWRKFTSEMDPTGRYKKLTQSHERYLTALNRLFEEKLQKGEAAEDWGEQ